MIKIKKPYCITIDAGTTNTRAVLWDLRSGSAVYMGLEKDNTGVRNTAADGHNGALKKAVKKCIDGLLERNNILAGECIVAAAGMITSNVGLLEVPHIAAPADVMDLARGVCVKSIPEVCSEPIIFVPGIKNNSGEVNLHSLEKMDIMRGEEVESIALISGLPEKYRGKACVFVIPGSHTKFVSVSGDGKILGCVTMLTGEILECITKNTVIADSVGRKFADELNMEALYEGFYLSRGYGMSRAAFLTRIYAQFTGCCTNDSASYLLGVVLGEDIRALETASVLNADKNSTIVVAGKEPLSTALDALLKKSGYNNTVIFDMGNSHLLSGTGILEVVSNM